MVRGLIAGAVLVAAAVTLIFAAGGDGRSTTRHPIPPPDPMVAFTARADRDGASQIFMLRADGSIRQLTHGIHSLNVRDWSPDRSQLLVTDASGNGAAILTLDLATGNLHTVWQHGGVVGAPSWSADGSRIGFVWSGRPYTMPSDGSRMVDVLPGHAATASLAWADRGLGLAIATTVDHRPTVVLTHGDRPVRHLSAACRLSARVRCFAGTEPAWSPSGAVACRCPSGHATGLCIVGRGSARADRVRLLGPGAQNPRLPAWSPVALAFVGDGGLFVSPDRSGQPRLAITLVASSAPSWSADGGRRARGRGRTRPRRPVGARGRATQRPRRGDVRQSLPRAPRHRRAAGVATTVSARPPGPGARCVGAIAACRLRFPAAGRRRSRTQCQ